jgi:hypothetical protein
VYHVVEVNEGVIDGDNTHFAEFENSPHDQVPSTAKCIHPWLSLSCLREVAGTAGKDADVCPVWRSKESPSKFFNENMQVGGS